MLAALMIGAGGLQAQIAPPLSPLLVEEPGLAITSRAAWQRQREVIRNRWQSFLGEWPREKAPLRTKVIATEELEGFTRQHVTYQIEEGVFTDAYLLTPANSKGKLPAVVVFHPTVSNHTHQVAGIDASDPEKMHGVPLVQRGYVVLCPRCFIFDEGADYAENVKWMQARHPGWTGMARMTWDGLRAADDLESLPQVDAERIGCLGHSLGAKESLEWLNHRLGHRYPPAARGAAEEFLDRHVKRGKK